MSWESASLLDVKLLYENEGLKDALFRTFLPIFDELGCKLVAQWLFR